MVLDLVEPQPLIILKREKPVIAREVCMFLKLKPKVKKIWTNLAEFELQGGMTIRTEIPLLNVMRDLDLDQDHVHRYIEGAMMIGIGGIETELHQNVQLLTNGVMIYTTGTMTGTVDCATYSSLNLI